MSETSTTPDASFESTVKWPLVRMHDHGHPVATVEYLLRARGQHLDADGDFGPTTEGAVRAFQHAKGLTADGIVGPKTWPALTMTVRSGDSGEAVKGVQQEANDRQLAGHAIGLTIDGEFGPMTEEFVRGLQQALRHLFPADDISVDGVVGPITWRALVAGVRL